MIEYTKASLTQALIDIANRGWIENRRGGNDGGVGNTLEDLLGIAENNLPLPNAAEWELKTHRKGSSSLLTLLHMEPSPRAMKIVSEVMLPKYGWQHKEAGKKYPLTEKSFRQTVNCCGTGRGFKLKVDNKNKRVVISFDRTNVATDYSDWLAEVSNTVGLEELNPVPYWGFDDLAGKLRTKLLNCFYVKAMVKRDGHKEFYHYDEIYRCSNFSFDKFLKQLEQGNVYVDFDARTGHNHGTKFRYAENVSGLEALYGNVIRIL